MPKIFLIEDDDSLRRELVRLLELSGYDVDFSDQFIDVENQALTSGADLALVDLMLPQNDGHQIVRAIRAEDALPIIVITSSDREFDEVMALNLGADDYLTKPFTPAVLLAHIQSVLRRNHKDALDHVLRVGQVMLDPASAMLHYKDASVELTRNELKILSLLMKQPKTVVSRSDIMAELWDSDEFVDDNTLTVNINRLRTKLTSLDIPGEFLLTRRGLGYVINEIP